MRIWKQQMGYKYIIIGNTNTRTFEQNSTTAAFFKTAELIRKDLLLNYDQQDCYFASVIPQAVAGLKNAYVITFRDINLKTNSVELENVGIDRLLNCYAVIDDFQDFMVVDLGTAISISVVKEGLFDGGFIMPGIDMSIEALSTGTAALEKVSFNKPSLFEAGKDTSKAINYGLFWSNIGAIKEIYSRTFNDDKAVPLVITGGNALPFKDELNDVTNNIIIDEQLQLKGLKKAVSQLSVTK